MKKVNTDIKHVWETQREEMNRQRKHFLKKEFIFKQQSPLYFSPLPCFFFGLFFFFFFCVGGVCVCGLLCLAGFWSEPVLLFLAGLGWESMALSACRFCLVFLSCFFLARPPSAPGSTAEVVLSPAGSKTGCARFLRFLVSGRKPFFFFWLCCCSGSLSGFVFSTFGFLVTRTLK